MEWSGRVWSTGLVFARPLEAKWNPGVPASLIFGPDFALQIPIGDPSIEVDLGIIDPRGTVINQ